jgi:hypothetical protein
MRLNQPHSPSGLRTFVAVRWEAAKGEVKGPFSSPAMSTPIATKCTIKMHDPAETTALSKWHLPLAPPTYGWIQLI